MLVSELISILSLMDQNMEVKVSYPSNDYWKTDLASDVNNVNEVEVVYSDYHNSYKIPSADKDITDSKTVVIIE